MKLENCELQIDRVVAAPMVRTEPEPEWVTARDAGFLPLAGFALYTRSSFLSFGAAPRFLNDEKHLLFSYFAMVLRSVRDALVDADMELRAFSENQARVYDLGKRIRAEEWDPAAPERARRHFRFLLLSLQAGLDGSADLIALFLTGLIPGLRLGRAQFSRLESWLERPLPPGDLLIVTPQRDFLERLYAKLSPLVNPGEPERDWLPLMRMLRNKAAHLGDAVFRYMALHDRDGRFYTFIPRQWPFIPEEHMHAADTSGPAPEPFPDLLRRTLMHEDIVSYASGLRRKVTDVISSVFEILDSAYVQCSDFPLNTAALAELQGSAESYAFDHFSG